ncbi:MAG: hypothetical protein GVY10_01985, partial [Verrucomicrobia bacterium]|nr:hypothetical protein [Verrucomicrobiota bacterium]
MEVHRVISMRPPGGQFLKQGSVCVVIAVCGLSLVNGAGGTFFPYPKLPSTGDLTLATIALASADIDEDGDVDLVMVRNLTDRVAVFLNDGEGHFDETQSIRAPADFFEVTPALELADMDGDGFPDLVFGGSDSARIYPNDGTGVFSGNYTELSAYSVPLGVGDLDLDGDLDVLKGVGLPYGVFFNDGDFSFTKGDDFYSYVEAFGLADLDGDSYLDIVEGYGRDLGVRLNNGDGTYGPETTYSANNSGELTRHYGLGFGDVDGDGDVDVASVSATTPFFENDPGSVGHLWLNDGTGSFAHSLILGDASEAWDVAIADVNGDGYGDLLYTSNDRVLDKAGDQRDLERSKEQRAYSLFGGSSLTVKLSNGDG